MNKKKLTTLTIIIVAIVLVGALSFSVGFFISKMKGSEYFAEDVQYKYIMKLQDKVEKNWAPPKDAKLGEVPVVSFVLHKDGKITDVRLKTSSGNKQVDDLAVKTIKKSAPFAKLPKNVDTDVVDFEFRFEFYHPEKE